jgi:hypothetical protein
MPQGLDHVNATLKLIDEIAGAIPKTDGLEQDWKPKATARLSAIAERLETSKDRFFLKSRLCIPFAAKCETAAQDLEALLTELAAHPAADAQRQINTALDGLDIATKTLDERSTMRGMAIT